MVLIRRLFGPKSSRKEQVAPWDGPCAFLFVASSELFHTQKRNKILTTKGPLLKTILVRGRGPMSEDLALFARVEEFCRRYMEAHRAPPQERPALFAVLRAQLAADHDLAAVIGLLRRRQFGRTRCKNGKNLKNEKRNNFLCDEPGAKKDDGEDKGPPPPPGGAGGGEGAPSEGPPPKKARTGSGKRPPGEYIGGKPVGKRQ